MVNNEKINIVCVGSNIESMVCLQKFKGNNITISGLVTLPFQQEKRGSDYRNLTPFCNENNNPFFKTKNINSNETKDWLRDINPDVIFILGWSQIFDKELINLPKKYIVGSHPSDLPFGAGRAPVVWTILEDLRKSAVSFFKINKNVDAGNLVLQKHFSILERTDSMLLYNLVSNKLSEGFIEIYNQIQNNTLSENIQDISRRTLRPKRVYEDGLLHFNKSAEEIDRLIRATTEPYPGAFSFYKGERYSIWKSELSNIIDNKSKIGEVLEIKKDRILVQCFESTVWLYDITDSSGETISAEKFEIAQQFDLDL
jgi:methionyl-tRNA formyltransferase